MNSRVNTSRPPKRSVNIPIGMRATEPNNTGTAIKNAVVCAERPKSARNVGANALISPHAAKQTANEIVPSTRFRAALEVLATTYPL